MHCGSHDDDRAAAGSSPSFKAHSHLPSPRESENRQGEVMCVLAHPTT